TEQGLPQRRNKKSRKERKAEQSKRCSRNATNSHSTRRKKQRIGFTDGEKFAPTQCDSWWEAEPGMGRVVNGLSGRLDRLKALGNGIVQEIAYEKFLVIRFLIENFIKII